MKKVKVIEVTTATCGICKSIAPMISKAVELLWDKVDFEKKQIDWDDDLVKEYDLRQVPTFLFFNGDEFLSKHVGAIMLPQFIKMVNDYYEKLNDGK